MNQLKQWMQARTAGKHPHSVKVGLQQQEAAQWLSDALKRKITTRQIRYWLKGEKGQPARIPVDVLEYISK